MSRTVRHDFSKPTTGDTVTTNSQSLAEVVAEPARSAAPAKVSPKALIRNAVEVNRREIENALPQGYVGGPERFARTVMTCVARDPNLLKCTPTSIIGAAMQAAQLGLTPGVLGEAWIVAYRDQATFQVGYRGLIALAARSGIVLQAHTVHERDEFTYELGLNPQLRHVPAIGNRGPSILWYAVAKDRANGDLLGFAVIDRDHVEKRRKSNRGNSPAWQDWFDEMALTKAIRECCKFLPLSVEMATAVASDGVVRDQVAGQADEFVADHDDTIDGEVLS
jgi:recombination protein RecT